MGTLSEMQKTLSEGQNPLPIFTAVNMKDGKSESTTEAGMYCSNKVQK